MNKNMVIGMTSIVIGVGCLVASVSAATGTNTSGENPCSQTPGQSGSGTPSAPAGGFGSGKMMQHGGYGDTERPMMHSGGLDGTAFGSGMTPPEGTGSGGMDRGQKQNMMGSGMIHPCENTNIQKPTTTINSNTKTTNTRVSTVANTKLQALKDRIAKLKAARLAKQKQTTSSTSVE